MEGDCLKAGCEGCQCCRCFKRSALCEYCNEKKENLLGWEIKNHSQQNYRKQNKPKKKDKNSVCTLQSTKIN